MEPWSIHASYRRFVTTLDRMECSRKLLVGEETFNFRYLTADSRFKSEIALMML